MKRKILLLISFCIVQIISSQDINLYNQFGGNIDFTMFGNTLNPVENGDNCSILTSSSATLNLDANDTIETAYLYWSGSGSGDFNVRLNNQNIVAERTFSLVSAGDPFFSAFAEVTTLLQTTGNGNYTLSDLDLTGVIDAANYCDNGTNFGGWAIIIVFSNDSLPVNQVNIYDGLESISSNNPEITILLDNLNVLDNTNAKVGFLAWEGDQSIAIGESLRINGNLISNPPLNPATNVFNGTNSFTGATDLYNMDLDFYNIEDYINVGDTSATVQLTSNQDFVMLNSVVIKLNLQLPDATVEINSFELLECNDREISIDFTVFNLGAEGSLPTNTPISLYANDVLLTTVFTQNVILSNQSENFVEIVAIPISIPENFILTIVVDDDGNGNSTVFETNELNNDDEIAITVFEVPIANLVPDLYTCLQDGEVLGEFDTSEIQTLLLGGVDMQLNMNVFYFDALGLPLSSPLPNPFVTLSQEITIVIVNPLNIDCSVTTTINFNILAFPTANPVTINSVCDDDQDGFALFDTSEIENTIILNQQNISLTYFNEDGSQILPTLPNPFETNSQTIIIIATNDLSNDPNISCTSETTLEFVVDRLPFIAENPIIEPLCDDIPNDHDGLSDFDTSEIESTLLGATQTTMTVLYFDENGISLPSPLPNPFTTASQTISVLIENPINTECSVNTTIDFSVILLPEFNIFDDTICLNFLPEPLIVTIENPQANYNYEWKNSNNEIIGTNLEQLEIFENGIYSVTATTQDDLACATTKFFTITETSVIFNQPENLLECDEGLDTAIFNLDETLEQITTDFSLDISFFTSEEDLVLFENEIIFTTEYTNTSDPQTIFVRIENPITNCYDSTTFLLETEDCYPIIPNAFTPNDDAFNQTYTINGLHDIFLDFEIQIYNRYGNLIYEGNNNKEDWDGTYKGEELATGTYFYFLKFNDVEKLYAPIDGWIYLNR